MAGRLNDWIEPAHPSVIRLHHELVTIYRHLRSDYQQTIDQAFDRVSQQIGYVVATALPVVLQVGDDGTIKSIAMGAGHLKNTLFEKELTQVLDGLTRPQPDLWQTALSAGSYKLYVFWYAALKLKLWLDWLKPDPPHDAEERVHLPPDAEERVHLPPDAEERVHLPPDAEERVHLPPDAEERVHLPPDAEERVHLPPDAEERVHLPPDAEERVHLPPDAEERVHVPPDPIEPAHPPYGRRGHRIPGADPAHWFNPGVTIAAEEAILIEAIDEVYPELRLVEHITAARAGARRPVQPEVREPAHVHRPEVSPDDKLAQLLAALAALLRRYGY